MSWFVKYMQLDVDIQHRLHDEACRIFGNDLDSTSSIDLDVFDNTEKTPILATVATETLRCAKVEGAISRRCELCFTSDGHSAALKVLNDDVIMGRHVPKGTKAIWPAHVFRSEISIRTDILIPTELMSLSESEWGPDAKVWRPSRWLRHDGSFDCSAGPSGDPFGIGHRACFGQRLAVRSSNLCV
jgi:hypothetical protein